MGLRRAVVGMGVLGGRVVVRLVRVRVGTGGRVVLLQGGRWVWVVEGGGGRGRFLVWLCDCLVLFLGVFCCDFGGCGFGFVGVCWAGGLVLLTGGTGYKG